ncbi:MAG: hypothetical protein ACK53L_10835, partial [Pirellulaceae bacterium]
PKAPLSVLVNRADGEPLANLSLGSPGLLLTSYNGMECDPPMARPVFTDGLGTLLGCGQASSGMPAVRSPGKT